MTIETIDAWTQIDPVPTPYDGWIKLYGSWTYVSTDGHVFVANFSQSLTGVIQVGDRLKLSDGGVDQYFIVLVVGNFSGGVCPITMYGGTNYALSGSSITGGGYYSHMTNPLGFQLNKSLWTETVTNTSNNTQSSPTSGTWYNIGSISIAIPIGLWSVSYRVASRCSVASGTLVNQYNTLSTANNSESNAAFTTLDGSGGALGNIIATFMGTLNNELISLSSKTTYYLNAKTTVSGLADIAFRGDVSITTITAVCAYL